MIGERDPRQRDPAFLGYVAKLPCLACMVSGKVKWGVQVAHLRAASPEHDKRYTGKGEKPSDRWVLPLCQPHHTGDLTRVPFSQHEMGELDFWARLGIADPFQVCIDLYAAMQASRGSTGVGLGVAVISKIAGAARRNLEGVDSMTEITKEMQDAAKRRDFYIRSQADGSLPKVALSIKQPWAWLMTRPIYGAVKGIENRTWRRGPPKSILVHAGQSLDEDCHLSLVEGLHPVTGEPWAAGQEAYVSDLNRYGIQRGGFVGAMDFTGEILTESDDPWFMGPFGYVTTNARGVPFLPWRGQLGFFAVEVTAGSILA